MTEEEANKYLNSFKDKMGYKDISLILKPSDSENDEEDKEELKKLKTIRNKLIEGMIFNIKQFKPEKYKIKIYPVKHIRDVVGFVNGN